MYKKKLAFLLTLAIANVSIGISHIQEATAFLLPPVIGDPLPVIGDLNCSGKVDVVDIQIVINVALGIPLPPELDANGDGYLDDCSPADVGICGDGTYFAAGYCSLDLCQCPAPPTPGMIYIPCGTFWMGCNEFKDNFCEIDEKPQHEVTLSAYWIDETEVTVADYQACVTTGECEAPEYQFADDPLYNYGSVGKEQHPINGVTWCQATKYCEWKKKRLPTEAEWEMAARGSCNHNADQPTCKQSMRVYPWGDEVVTCNYAVIDEGGWGCGGGGTSTVGSKPKGNSPYGVRDLSGNVWEWVEDCYDTYSNESVVDPVSLSCGDPAVNCVSSFRVLRGGAFGGYQTSSERASDRLHDKASDASVSVGFRCAWSPVKGL